MFTLPSTTVDLKVLFSGPAVKPFPVPSERCWPCPAAGMGHWPAKGSRPGTCYTQHNCHTRSEHTRGYRAAPEHSTYVCVTCFCSSVTCVQLFATPWTAALQAPLSMGFSRQESWGRLPFPSQLRDQTQVPCIAGRFFTI